MAASARESRIQSIESLELRIELLGFLQIAPSWTGTIHQHAFWELLYYMRGGGTLTIDETAHVVVDKSLFLVPPAVPHQLSSESAIEHLYIGFAASDASVARQFDWPAAHDSVTDVQVSTMLDDIVTNLDLSLRDAVHRNRWRVVAALSRYLCGVLGSRDAQDQRDRTSRSIADRALEYIIHHRSQSITVREVADSLYVSSSYLADCVKRATGQTIKELHRRERLAYATELLRNPRYSITDIAKECGYSSLHYFSREYSRHYGVPPTRARDELQQRSSA